MLRERTLPCPISRIRRINPRVRAMGAEDEPLDRASEAIFAIALRYEVRRSLYLGAGVSHRDAETASLKHRDVIASVTDGSDFRQGNTQQFAISDNAAPLLASGCVMSR